MDVVNSFMELFLECRRNLGNNGYTNLENLLKPEAFKQHFQLITTNDAGPALDTILSGPNGILNFLTIELKDHYSYHESLIANIFENLSFLIQTLKRAIKSHLADILKCTSEAIGKTGLKSKAKIKAIETFRILLENFHDLDVHMVTETLEKQWNLCKQIRKYATDFAFLLFALCIVAKFHPYILNDRLKNKLKHQIITYLNNNIYSMSNKTDSPTMFLLHLTALEDLSLNDKIIATEHLKSLSNCLQKILEKEISADQRSKTRNDLLKDKIMNLYVIYMPSCINFIIPNFYHIETTFKTLLKSIYLAAASGLKALYNAMADHLEIYESDYKDLKKHFQQCFDKMHANSSTVQLKQFHLLLYGYGKLAAPCRKLESNEKVIQMFEWISQQIMSRYMSEDDIECNLKLIPDCQETLSHILLFIEYPSIVHLTPLIKLTTLLIKKFPEYDERMKTGTVTSMKQTIAHVHKLGFKLFDIYLNEIIYEGIVWTCSHTLRIDEEIQKDTTNYIITYKNYIPLWKKLISSENDDVRDYNVNRLYINVFKKIIHQYPTFLSQLNLRTKVNESNVFSEDPLSREPENDSDFRIFINLSEFYEEIIEECDQMMLEDIIYDILYHTIKHSYEDPTISAYYKIVNAVFKTIDPSYWNSWHEKGKEKVFDLVSTYISHLLDTVGGLLKEPQIVCLCTILNTPFTEEFLKQIPHYLDRVIPVFQLALKVGTSDLTIAFNALNTVRSWMESPLHHRLDDLLNKILPFLEPYLHSVESNTGMSLDMLQSLPKSIKCAAVINNDYSLKNFQHQILLLFGSISSDIMKDYIYEKSMQTEVTWEQRQPFNYSLPFSEFQINVNLMKILPRTIDLALNSGDRQTKVAACELLHCFIIMILGSRKEDTYFDKNLCTAVLKLGCDVDNVVMQIFSPLCIELINYLSSANKFKSHAAGVFFESVFDGLADEDSTSDFKEFCGVCLKTFYNNQTSEEGLQKSPASCEMIVNKIYHFALHPATVKRVAAAVAFNHLFKDGQVDDEYNKYLIKLLFCFIKSLEKYEDWRILQSIRLLVKTMVLRSELLSEDLDLDELSAEFGGESFQHAVIWILKHCGSLDVNQRRMCMEIFEKLSPQVNNCGSMQNFLNFYLGSSEQLHEICLKNLNIDYNDIDIASLKCITCSLDCYIWILEKDLVDFTIFFKDERQIFQVVQKCSTELIDKGINNPNKVLITVICEAVFKIIQFVETCLKKEDNNWNFLDETFWSSFFKLLKNVILLPSTLKVNTENLQYIETFRPLLFSLLKIINTTKDAKITQNFMRIINGFGFWTHCLKIRNEENEIRYQNEILCGCLILYEFNILNKIEQGQKIIDESKKIKKYFKVLVKEHCTATGDAIYYPCHLNPETLSFFTNYMKICLLEYDPAVVKKILQLTQVDKIIDNFSKKTHGDLFFNTFRTTIFNGLLKNVNSTITIMVEMLNTGNISNILYLFEDLSMYVYECREINIDDKRNFAREMLLKCNTLVKLIDDQRRAKFINIYKHVVHLLDNPMEVNYNKDYYSLKEWILSQFSNFRIEMVQNFLICLTDSTIGPFDDSLLTILVSESSQSINDIIAYFSTLSKILPVTKSLVVLKAMIKYSSGKSDVLFSDTTVKHLAEYIQSIPDKNVVESLKIAYDLFIAFGDKKKRRDILDKYLWFLLNCCNFELAKQFYHLNIKQIYTTIAQEFPSELEDIEQTTISKTGCYKLLAHMLAIIERDDTNYLKQVSQQLGMTDNSDFLANCIKHAIRIRTYKSDINSEYLRLLHCQAYNCYLVLCTFTKNQRNIIQGLLNSKDGKVVIWENIVDEKEQKILQQTLTEQPKTRREFINLRRSARMEQTKSQAYSFVHYYDLNTSSLREDINTFDFNESKSTSSFIKDEWKSSGSIVEYKDIDYNNHECMQTICKFFDFLIDSKLIDIDKPETPNYVICIRQSLVDTKSNPVRLFLMRVILNSKKTFVPYMKDIMWGIIYAICGYLQNNHLNYVITEILYLIVESVDSNNICPTPQYQNVARLLVNKVIEETVSADVDAKTFAFNLELLKLLVHCWQNIVDLPVKYIEKTYRAFIQSSDYNEVLKKEVRSMINVIMVFLSENVTKNKLLLSFRNPELNLKQMIFNILKQGAFNLDNLKMQICEALGLILEEAEFDDYNFTLYFKYNSNTDIKCIFALCKSNPKLGLIYREIAFAKSKITNESKQRCINILILLSNHLSEELMIKDLELIQFYDTMYNISSCAKVGLELVEVLVTKFKPSNLIQIAEITRHFANNNDPRLRAIVYTIFKKIFRRFSNETDNDSQWLIDTSISVLMNGLGDSSDELVETVCDFLTEETTFSNNFFVRLVDLLKMYKSDDEKHYLLFLCVAMFGLTKKSFVYNNKVYNDLFGTPEDYETYSIRQDYRTRTLIYRTPLYVKSCASQLSQVHRFSDHSTLRQSLMSYSDTQLSEKSIETKEVMGIKKNDIDFKGLVTPFVSKEWDPSLKITDNKMQTKDYFKHRQINKNKALYASLQNEPTRRKNHVKVYRSYAIGKNDTSVPNIALTHANIITSLLQLMKKDGPTCKNIFVSFMRELLQYYEISLPIKTVNLKNMISEKIENILSNAQSINPIVYATLELLYYTDLQYNAKTVARVTKLNGITEVGILLLEKKILHPEENCEPLEKKARGEITIDSDVYNWVQLASLYKSLGNTDVVLSIYKNYISGSHLKEASLAQITSNWNVAASAYEKAAQNEQEGIREHCLEGMYECYSQLANWTKIDDSIKHEVRNLDNIFNKHANKEWLAPWVFRAKLMKKLLYNEDTVTNKFTNWLMSREYGTVIKRNYSEEIVMFYVHNRNDHAKHLEWLKCSLTELHEQWQQTSPLSAQQRIAKVRRLRSIAEVTTFINHFNENQVLDLLQYWQHVSPSSNDDYASWHLHTAYRLHFSEILLEVFQNYKDELQAENFRLIRAPVHIAIEHKNKPVVKRFMKMLENHLSQSVARAEDVDNMNFDIACYRAMCAELEEDKRVEHYSEVWKKLEYFANEYPKVDLKISSRQLLAKICLKLSDYIDSDESLLRKLPAFIVNHHSYSTINEAKEYFVSKAFDFIREGAGIIDCKQGGKSQMTLARFCYNKINNDCERIGSINVVKTFYESIFNAMACNENEASLYFPCLLNEKYLRNSEIQEIFIAGCKNIETWMFLSWQTQIMSFLDTSVADSVIPIISRIVEDYPSAIYHTFILIIQLKPHLLNNPIIASMQEKLVYSQPDLKQFHKSLTFIVKPLILLSQKVWTTIKKLEDGFQNTTDLIRDFDLDSVKQDGVKSNKNNHYSALLTYRVRILSALNKTPKDALEDLKRIHQTILEEEDKMKSKKDSLLSYYSPWLANYSGSEIEVPGQYKGDRKPTPKYHTKIVRMESKVQVMQSKCKPIKITMLGNDGKSYSFLAKMGDDLRLDQRIQQTLSFVNKLLNTDKACRDRNLSIYTYQVFPYNTTFGLIEWINDTKTLLDFIPESKRRDAYRNYQNWVRSDVEITKDYSVAKVYKTLLKKNAEQVCEMMNELINKVKSDSMRETFFQICPSLESFITIRHTFTVSYATMCMAHWIMGIGDRHLKNTLVEIKSGKCIGIDFSLAFGAGLDLSVPEFIPFRLTPQILNVLKPFSEYDLFAITMINVLEALKENQGPLMACLNIFVNDCLNWEDYISRKFDCEDTPESEDTQNREAVEWLPKNRIDFVKSKLGSIHPSKIMISQMLSNPMHSLDTYTINRYVNIIKGSDCDAKRSKQPEDNLSSEKQVACLLDQATDLNILGRSFEGLETWL